MSHPGHVEGRCLGCIPGGGAHHDHTHDEALATDPREALDEVTALVLQATAALDDEAEGAFREAVLAMHSTTTRLATLVRAW